MWLVTGQCALKACCAAAKFAHFCCYTNECRHSHWCNVTKYLSTRSNHDNTFLSYMFLSCHCFFFFIWSTLSLRLSYESCYINNLDFDKSEVLVLYVSISIICNFLTYFYFTASQRGMLCFLLHYICLTALVTFQIIIFQTSWISFPLETSYLQIWWFWFFFSDKLKD